METDKFGTAIWENCVEAAGRSVTFRKVQECTTNAMATGIDYQDAVEQPGFQVVRMRLGHVVDNRRGLGVFIDYSECG
jgi:hypothetical protein